MKSPEPAEWHIITSEYPPQTGGVSDYTKLIANELAAGGDDVHVWCPGEDQRSEIRGQGSEAAEFNVGKLVVHRELGRFSPGDLRRVGKLLDDFAAPRRLLVQWVPQGYGYRSMNLPFCGWLWRRAKHKKDRLELMVHEPFLAFGEGSSKHYLAAAIHRLMIVTLLQAAHHVWVSIPDWERQLRPFAPDNKSFGWLPVPSNIPFVEDPEGIAKIREQYTVRGNGLVGHFGAYDQYLTELMRELLPSLLNGTGNCSLLLLGKGSVELRDRVVEANPGLANAIHASGNLPAEDLSRHLSACDLMLQPYQDGVSGRRTSAMSALSHGVPVVTTRGKATEDCWAESDAVKLTNCGDIGGIVDAVKSLLGDRAEATRLQSAAQDFYKQYFDVKQTISKLSAGVNHQQSPGTT